MVREEGLASAPGAHQERIIPSSILALGRHVKDQESAGGLQGLEGAAERAHTELELMQSQEALLPCRLRFYQR